MRYTCTQMRNIHAMRYTCNKMCKPLFHEALLSPRGGIGRRGRSSHTGCREGEKTKRPNTEDNHAAGGETQDPKNE